MWPSRHVQNFVKGPTDPTGFDPLTFSRLTNHSTVVPFYFLLYICLMNFDNVLWPPMGLTKEG